VTRYRKIFAIVKASWVMEYLVTIGKSGNSTSSRLLCGLVLSVEKSVTIHPVGRQKGWMVNQQLGVGKVKWWDYYLAAPTFALVMWCGDDACV
jgi:hypothetical protein